MLYITTRNKDDAYTTYRALVNDNGPDGGFFAPFHLPNYDKESLDGLKDKNFNQTIAEVLNHFLNLGLDGYDLDLEIGRNLVRVNTIGRRTIFAELWHNLGGKLAYIEEALLNKLALKADTKISNSWAGIAVKIAVIFGIYGQMLRDGATSADEPIDFSVFDDAFATIIALWYCRSMGMPINMIICTCDESSFLWDFVNRGTVQTGNVDTGFLIGAEKLLYAAFDHRLVNDYLLAVKNNQTYSLSEEALAKLKRHVFCSVAGKDRAKSVINSVYRTSEYIIDDKTALCYGGLQDFRAKNGGSTPTVILAENTPCDCLRLISEATGLDALKIKKLIK